MLEIKCAAPIAPYGSNSYIISSADEYAIIDPSAPYNEVSRQYNLEGKRLKYIIVTHAHFDHILCIDSWSQMGAVTYVGREDQASLSDSYKNCYSLFLGENKVYYGKSVPLGNGDILKLGDDEIRVISTPGHTPGGIALASDNVLFSGDTIFAKGYGRYDLPGGDREALVNSIEKLLSLPDDITVYSGHGEPATVREIKIYLNF